MFSKYLSYFIGKVILNRSVSSVPSYPTDGVRWDTPSGSDGTVKTIWISFDNKKPGSFEYCKKC